MAEFSQFWDTTGTGDGLVGGYTENDWLEFYQTLFIPEIAATAGILPRSGNKLAVSGTANNNIQVATGRAIVYGWLYKNTTALAVPSLSVPLLGTTGFRIVLRVNWAAQTVRVAVLMSADGVASIPAVTQTVNTTWEISLATGTITIGNAVTLTDTRAYTKFNTMIEGSHLQADIVDSSTIEIASNVLRVKDAGITAAKLAAAVAGNGLSGGAGTALAVNVDASSIEINADTLRVKALGITTAMLANDAVDDTKVGNRVPQFYRRRGGNAGSWHIGGNTNYTPTTVRQQAGSHSYSGAAAAGGVITITLPQAFSDTHIPFAWATDSDVVLSLASTSATNFNVGWKTVSGGTKTTFDIRWFTVGPE